MEVVVKRKLLRFWGFSTFLITLSLFILVKPLFPAELGEPLKILSHDYGFFSGDYYSWSTRRGMGETVEIFVENAIWDSSITDSSYGLPSNLLTSLESDGQGGIYIGTSGGLAQFDGTSFTDYSQSFNKYIVDLSFSNSTLWIATADGLYKYENGLFSLYFNNEITTVMTGSDNIVWVGTLEGLFRWDVSDSSSTAYPSVDTLNSPVSDVIRDIEIDVDGNPWLATDKGISYLDGSGTWQVISSLHNLISDNVNDLTLIDDGIWVGTNKGLTLYVNDTSYTKYERKNSGLTTNSIRKVKLNNSVRWIATGDGLFQFKEDYDWHHFGMDHTNYLEAHTTDTLNSLDIRDITFVGNDVYLATSWGLTRYGSSDGSWETWRGPYHDKTVYADSALVATVLEVWENHTPGLDTSHYFYNGIAEALGVSPGGDTLGVYEEITKLFGNVSDVDNNGKVSVFLLDIRDYWDDSDNSLDGLGDLTFDGFFLEQNLFSVEPTMRMDLLYIEVRRQSQVEIEMALAKTLTKHILYNNDPDEDTWITEGFGMLSEILTGYVDQTVGFKGFDKLNYPCKNSILTWQSSNPYLDQQFSELLLLFTAEKYQSGDDGGLGILLDIAKNSDEQGIDAFSTALSNYGSTDTFSDLYFNLGITATIENWKNSTMPDHRMYNFTYHTIGSVTEYNTIYWGKNNQDSPPYMGSIPQWSSRIFNGRTLWATALEEFRLLKFNGADDNHFRVALLLNTGTKPDTSTVVVELPLDEDNETIYAFLDTLSAHNYKTYSVIYISDFGDGTGITQMVMSQDVVSPDAFGGINTGVVQNPLEEKLIDIYITSYEGLCRDVGDATFTDDGGIVSVISDAGTTIIPMEKFLEDESNYSFTYEFTYNDTTTEHTGTTSQFYLYHAEYTIPADGDYDITVSGQDVSGNDATSDTTSFTVGSVGSSGRRIVHSSGDFSVDFDEGTVEGLHTVLIIPVPETYEARSLNKSIPTSDFGFADLVSRNEPLSKVYKVGPELLLLKKPVTIRFSLNIASISVEDRPYTGVFRYLNGEWISLPSRITTDGFIEAETDHLGNFQLQKGDVVVEQVGLPMEYALHQNYPNPFNPQTTIRYDLPEDANVSIYIHNILGQLVSVITEDSYHSAGYHSIVWNSTDRFGEQVSSGLYFYIIRAGNYSATKKMLLIR